jgi:hypothetical protein
MFMLGDATAVFLIDAKNPVLLTMMTVRGYKSTEKQPVKHKK